jgi:hypothetical protein
VEQIILYNREITLEETLEKLRYQKLKKTKSIAWVSFPYSTKNMEIIEDALTKVFQSKKEYRLTYDENIVFVEKDVFKFE